MYLYKYTYSYRYTIKCVKIFENEGNVLVVSNMTAMFSLI